MSRIELDDMIGGLNTAEPTKIKDNQFEVLQNMFYNSDYRLQTRAGLRQFWNQIGSAPITSLFSFQNDTTWVNYLLATAGTALYQYNETTSNFDSVQTGLSEFEADGTTRTRWSFAVYLNKVYMCNGVDAYAEYDPATQTYTEQSGEPRVRHLAFLWDAIYGGGADANPNTLYFTNAGATDGRNLDENSLVVWGDEAGRINGLEELQQQVQVFKDRRVYSVAGDGSSALPTDSESGGYSDRAIKRVANTLLNLSERGIDALRARNGVWSTQALETKPLSDNVRDIFAQIRTRNRQFSASEYVLPLTNYYITMDTSNDSIPDTTLVYSSLTQGWSEYTYPAINDYTQYTDTQGEIRYLAASANAWVVYEIEAGFSDLISPITCSLRTKKFDFNKPTVYKTCHYVDIVGFKSLWESIQCNVYIDDRIAGGSEITDEELDQERAETVPIGTRVLWEDIIWGGVRWTEVELSPFFSRIPVYNTGATIQVELTSSSTNLTWTLEKIAMEVEDEEIELFEYSNII